MVAPAVVVFGLGRRAPAAGAPPPPPMRMGLLSSGNDAHRGALERAFLQGRREQGYVEGGNVTAVRRYGAPANVRENAVSRAGMKLDAVRTTCTPSTRAMKDAGASTPIVMAAASDPVRQGKDIARLASSHRLPGVYWAREFVDAGGLLSYGPSLTDSYPSAAGYMVRITRGAVPGAFPVEPPTRFELVVNLASARALDVDVSQSVHRAADDVLR